MPWNLFKPSTGVKLREPDFGSSYGDILLNRSFRTSPVIQREIPIPQLRKPPTKESSARLELSKKLEWARFINPTTTSDVPIAVKTNPERTILVEAFHKLSKSSAMV